MGVDVEMEISDGAFQNANTKSIIFIYGSDKDDEIAELKAELAALKNELLFFQTLNFKNNAKIRSLAEKLVQVEKKRATLENVTITWTNNLKGKITNLEKENEELKQFKRNFTIKFT
jgi:chromosome segregation ATPase